MSTEGPAAPRLCACPVSHRAQLEAHERARRRSAPAGLGAGARERVRAGTVAAAALVGRRRTGNGAALGSDGVVGTQRSAHARGERNGAGGSSRCLCACALTACLRAGCQVARRARQVLSAVPDDDVNHESWVAAEAVLGILASAFREVNVMLAGLMTHVRSSRRGCRRCPSSGSCALRCPDKVQACNGGVGRGGRPDDGKQRTRRDAQQDRCVDPRGWTAKRGCAVPVYCSAVQRAVSPAPLLAPPFALACWCASTFPLARRRGAGGGAGTALGNSAVAMLRHSRGGHGCSHAQGGGRRVS